MFGVLQLAKEAKNFEEDRTLFHNLEKSLQGLSHDEDKDTPVFNKRLFASQGKRHHKILPITSCSSRDNNYIEASAKK